MYDSFREFLQGKKSLCIIQAENPDGDSLGSAIALDYILQDSENTLYCPVDIPKYLRYFSDWSRVTNEFDYKADGYIIVDTAASVLLSKLLDDPAIKNTLYSKPVFVLDHHKSEDDLEFPHEVIIEALPACAALIYKIATTLGLTISEPSASAIYSAISSDTLGLVSASVTSDTMRIMADLIDLGANPAELDEARREFMKKSPRILDYKADLIKRIDYALDGALATIHIPFEDIQAYSERNESNLMQIGIFHKLTQCNSPGIRSGRNTMQKDNREAGIFNFVVKNRSHPNRGPQEAVFEFGAPVIEFTIRFRHQHPFQLRALAQILLNRPLLRHNWYRKSGNQQQRDDHRHQSSRQFVQQSVH